MFSKHFNLKVLAKRKAAMKTYFIENFQEKETEMILVIQTRTIQVDKELTVEENSHRIKILTTGMMILRKKDNSL